ncbi:MAG: type II toxin-antitoxin system PemK/MazF family toxin [Acidobacteria bacterium]|nr:type II toxin-antitoxin system PemK/MazF family toxin [Acidobacteriota bacterium]
MVVFEPAAVVVLNFPFSDFSASKHRPAVVLAAASSPEWIVCPVTSNPFSDPAAVELVAGSFLFGGLRGRSFARPLKVFAADPSLVTARVGTLTQAAFRGVIEPLLNALSASLLK